MAPSTKQVRLPFDQLTEANLKPIIKKFEKWGVNFANVDAPNKAKRESGSLVKDVTFTVDDGQKVLIRVKADGTVFQVKLNKNPVPIRTVDDIDKAIIEIADYVQSNAKAYDRAKIARERKKKLAIPTPSIVTTRKEKIIAAARELEAVSATNIELEGKSTELDAASANKGGELESVTKRLDAEKEKTALLEVQLEALKSATKGG